GLAHDPEKWEPVYPRDKRGAFARRSCANKTIGRDYDSKKRRHALAARLSRHRERQRRFHGATTQEPGRVLACASRKNGWIKLKDISHGHRIYRTGQDALPDGQPPDRGQAPARRVRYAQGGGGPAYR